MAPLAGGPEEYPVLTSSIRLIHLQRLYRALYKPQRMRENPLLSSQCHTVRSWFFTDALSTYAMLLAFNVALVCCMCWARAISAAVVRRLQQRRKGRDFIYNLEECPICLNQFCDPVRLTCAHVNCLECLITYCRVMGRGCVFRCSLCRRPIADVCYLDGYTPSTLPKNHTYEMLGELREWLCKQPRRTIRTFISPGVYIVFLFILELTLYFNYCEAMAPYL